MFVNTLHPVVKTCYLLSYQYIQALHRLSKTLEFYPLFKGKEQKK